MLKDLFKKSNNYGTVKNIEVQEEVKPNIPSGMWEKCEKCSNIIYHEDLIQSHHVCNSCNYHFRLTAHERIRFLCDENGFRELFKGMKTVNPINFEGYEEKLEKAKLVTESTEGVVTGIGFINGIKVALGVMDSKFMMGSMGTVVGEKITRIIEYATRNTLPVILFTTSGGARMQEGIFSLMQMAKISAAIGRHDEAGLLYITVLTDPTTGGVTASFAMEGDIILAEPKSLIGFAGRRVIENTIKEKLPDDFQTSEFLLEKGFIDNIVQRKDLRRVLYKILSLHGVKAYEHDND